MEGDLLAGLDRDRFAGCRIAAHPHRPLAHLERAEAAEPVATRSAITASACFFGNSCVSASCSNTAFKVTCGAGAAFFGAAADAFRAAVLRAGVDFAGAALVAIGCKRSLRLKVATHHT